MSSPDFDVIDRHRLVGQIDTRLQQRLAQVARDPDAAGSIDEYDNAHDVDDAPVFLWTVTESGTSTALTPGSPPLPRSAWSPSKPSGEARLGTERFALQAERVGANWIVAAQSLADVDHIESELLLPEVIAGPVLLVALFLRDPADRDQGGQPRWSWPVAVSSNSRLTPLTSSARRSASSRQR